jgi:hypothetical protein
VTNTDTGVDRQLVDLRLPMPLRNGLYECSEVILPNTASGALRMEVRDYNGDTFILSSDKEILFDTSSLTGEFSESKSSWIGVNAVTMIGGTSTALLYYKDSTVGTYTITVSASGVIDVTQTLQISESAPYRFPFEDETEYTAGVGIDINTGSNSLARISPQVGTSSSSTVLFDASTSPNFTNNNAAILEITDQGYRFKTLGSETYSFGTGADGACSWSGGTINTTVKSTYNCTSVTMSGNITVSGNNPLIIYSLGDIDASAATLTVSAGGAAGGARGQNGSGLGVGSYQQGMPLEEEEAMEELEVAVE